MQPDPFEEYTLREIEQLRHRADCLERSLMEWRTSRLPKTGMALISGPGEVEPGHFRSVWAVA